MLLPNKRMQLFFLILLCMQPTLHALSTLQQSDPYPVYNSLDPQTFLQTREKLRLKGFDVKPEWNEIIGLYGSVFGQNADVAKTFDEMQTEVGDLYTGRTSMIALLYGDVPRGKTLPPLLVRAQQILFPQGAASGLNDPDYIDKLQAIGFFSFPATYRKRGVRFEFAARLYGDFGLNVQTSIAEQCLTVTDYRNLTPNAATGDWKGNSDCNRPIPKCDINKYLMDELKIIAQELCLSIACTDQTSIEEVRVNGWWRHAIPINNETYVWPEFLLIPYFQVSGSVSPGTPRDPHKYFSIGFGNNRHNSVGFDGGLDFDFFDTVEIGVNVGYTHFFKRNCMELRVPNSTCQTGIYPFTTDVSRQPGDNWVFAGKLSCWHFLDNLSGYFQYMIVQHMRDKICVLNGDPAFQPQILERISDWQVHLFNSALTYDLSPNISLGLLWQAPLVQRRVYRSTTLLFSFNFTY